MAGLKQVVAVVASALSLASLATPSASAGAIVWGLNPVSGDIVRIDPVTGALLGSFQAPILPLPGDTRAGLSIAEGGRTLLYQLGNNGPGNEVPGRDLLYGLDPFTGVVKFQVNGLGSSFGPDGLSWESQGGSTFTFINHANPISDIHRIENIGKPSEQAIEFWGPGKAFHHSYGGLGGDGNGREFGVFIDINDQFGGHRFIGEYDPFNDVSAFLNAFVAPADDLVGLAFDGRFLYASSASGPLYTLDPNTGAVIRSVMLPPLLFPDGSPAPYRFDIAAVPEPATVSLIVLGLIAIGMGRRWSTRSDASSAA